MRIATPFLVAVAGLASADTLILIDDTAGWQARVVDGGQDFPFTPENLLLADQVSSLPGNNASLGTVLTFRSSSTGFISDVELRAVGTTGGSTSWIYQDRGIPGILGPGDIDTGSPDDDYRVTFGPGGVFAFGIDLCGNSLATEGESFEVFGLGGELLATVALPLSIGADDCPLLSVVSTTPIGSIEIDDEANVDDVFSRRFRIGERNWCGIADLVAPFGVLDLTDIDAFIAAFGSDDPLADVAEPLGVLDLDDIDAFIASFLGGCPTEL